MRRHIVALRNGLSLLGYFVLSWVIATFMAWVVWALATGRI